MLVTRSICDQLLRLLTSEAKGPFVFCPSPATWGREMETFTSEHGGVSSTRLLSDQTGNGFVCIILYHHDPNVVEHKPGVWASGRRPASLPPRARDVLQ